MIIIQTNDSDIVIAAIEVSNETVVPERSNQSIVQYGSVEDFIGMVFDHETKTILGPVTDPEPPAPPVPIEE